MPSLGYFAASQPGQDWEPKRGHGPGASQVRATTGADAQQEVADVIHRQLDNQPGQP
jgi:hypothetical protein